LSIIASQKGSVFLPNLVEISIAVLEKKLTLDEQTMARGAKTHICAEWVRS